MPSHLNIANRFEYSYDVNVDNLNMNVATESVNSHENVLRLNMKSQIIDKMMHKVLRVSIWQTYSNRMIG